MTAQSHSGLTRELCKALLDASGPVTLKELAETLDTDAQRISARLYPLIANGHVERIVEAGEKHRYQVIGEATIKARAEGLRTTEIAKAEGGKKKRKQRKDSNGAKEPEPDSALAFFIDEEGDVQIVDEGSDPFIVPRADALRLAAFLARVKPLLES